VPHQVALALQSAESLGTTCLGRMQAVGSAQALRGDEQVVWAGTGVGAGSRCLGGDQRVPLADVSSAGALPNPPACGATMEQPLSPYDRRQMALDVAVDIFCDMDPQRVRGVASWTATLLGISDKTLLKMWSERRVPPA
jgi:hypothetical protein